MKLFKISLKNIQKSFKDYAIYFFTLILGVSIFYVFNALDSQTVMMKVSQNTRDIVELMINVLSSLSVLVAFILGFLIIYASRFLMKRRNKEFGIYMLLGMSKRKISTILLLETILIGLISLVVGLVIGIGLSQVMSIFVVNMFEADLTEFVFTFSKAAMLKTIIYFAIMYLMVMIFNTISVSKCKLIDLLYANRRSEEVKMKNPILCTVVFLLASAILGYAYYLVTVDVKNMQTFDSIFIPINLGIVATFLIFWSLSGLMIKVVSSMKNVYYKGLNSFTFRQISSKINTTIFSMSIICLMLFVTICVLSSALSVKNAATQNLKNLIPVDVEIAAWVKNGENELIMENSVVEYLNENGFNTNKYLKDLYEFNIYQTDELTFKDFLGSTLDQVLEEFPHLRVENNEQIITISEYNKLATLYGKETFTLADDEYIVIANYDSFVLFRNAVLEKNTAITLLGEKYYPKYSESKDGFVDIAPNPLNTGVIIVPDHAVTEEILCNKYLVANYTDESNPLQIGEMIEDALHGQQDDTLFYLATKTQMYESSIGLGSMATFIGLYLGVVFLIACVAILALKELSESTDNKERYQMLRNIGADEAMINRSLFRQIGIFFLLPLLLAIIHSIFGIQFCNYILVNFGKQNLITPIVMTSVFLVVIYGGYFIITYLSSKNIIKENN